MKKLIYSLLMGMTLLLAGCFDIQDEIWLEEKGSGRFQSTIDMSGMKDMMNMVMTMMPDSLKDKDGKLPEDMGIKDSIMSMWKDLEKIPGISQVKREQKSDMVFIINFQFSDIRSLNAAMEARSKHDSLGNIGQRQDFFSFSKGRFQCNDTSMSGLGDAMKGLDEAGAGTDSSALNMDMLKAFMGDMRYSHVYHLPGKIETFSNKDAKLSADGKTITLTLDLTDSERKQSLLNSIKYQ